MPSMRIYAITVLLNGNVIPKCLLRFTHGCVHPLPHCVAQHVNTGLWNHIFGPLIRCLFPEVISFKCYICRTFKAYACTSALAISIEGRLPKGSSYSRPIPGSLRCRSPLAGPLQASSKRSCAIGDPA